MGLEALEYFREEQAGGTMSTKFSEYVLSDYLATYQELVVAEDGERDEVTLSFPMHFSGNHRVELTITKISEDKFVLSDQARTLGELEDSGYAVSAELKERLEKIAGISGLRTVQDHLLLESNKSKLGADIQRMLEATKTIGDVYLVHKSRPTADRQLISEIKGVLKKNSLPYKEKTKLRGEIEDHPFDIIVPANGRKGIAFHVLAGQATHQLAQVWGFKCDDIRREPSNENMRLGLIYDVRHAQWSDSSRTILQKRADFAIPGSSISELPKELVAAGVL